MIGAPRPRPRHDFKCPECAVPNLLPDQARHATWCSRYDPAQIEGQLALDFSDETIGPT